MDEPKISFIYLDKNVLHYDFEGTIRIEPIENVCFVYSDEHFNEISRFEDERIFDVVSRIKARKLKVILDSNKFKGN